MSRKQKLQVWNALPLHLGWTGDAAATCGLQGVDCVDSCSPWPVSIHLTLSDSNISQKLSNASGFFAAVLM